jgi:murein L,D-transpeptidase YafK
LALIGVALLGLIAWEFLQLGRTVPTMAAADERATALVLEKSARRLTLLRGEKILRTYEVALGRAPEGHKQQEGDGRTPEGLYSIDFKNPRSRFHLALRVSYPSEADRADAQSRGVSPGSDIMIHGVRNGLGWLGSWHRALDWTDGCAAVTNSEIEDIWARVNVGAPIEIRP